MSTPPLTLALVGAGRMARTRARTLSGLPEVRVRAVCDSHPERAEALARDLGASATSEPGTLLDDPSLDVILISTPTATHADLIVRAAEAGKHVFVEKPVASDLAGADRALRAVERAGVQCQVGFQRRYDPAHVEAKRRIEAGELGVVEGYRAVSRDAAPPSLDYLRTSGGILADLGIHDFDTARFFVGEVSEVQAIGAVQALPELAEHGMHDAAVAILRFENGALGTLECGLRTAHGYEARTEVLGSRGRLHLEVESRMPLRHHTAEGVGRIPLMDYEQRFRDAYAEEVRAFVRALRDDRPVTPDIRDARASLRLALAAQTALERSETVRLSDFQEVPA